MPSHRFFLDSHLEPKESCFLEGSEHHHLKHVMRVGEGEQIELVNGKGMLAIAQVVHIEKQKTKLLVLSAKVDEKPKFELRLAIPFLRPSKLEWILEKGTELGVDAFILYPAVYSEVKAPSANQLERFHALLIAALKQSGRLYIPSLKILSHLSSLFEQEGSFFFCDPNATKYLNKATSPLIFITGPEKGFHEKETALFKEKNIDGLKLSPYILRAETAPIVAAAQIQYLIF